MTNVSKAMEYATTFEREAMREKLDAEERMIPIDGVKECDELFKKYQADGWIGPTSFKAALREYGALVRKEDDTLRDLLELKQLVTTMMEFKTPTKVFGPNLEQVLNAAGFYRKKEWVGLTEEEKHDCYLKIDVWSRCVEAVEAKLKEKNGG